MKNRVENFSLAGFNFLGLNFLSLNFLIIKLQVCIFIKILENK